jgi:putative hydrolase of the HAD superfamily
VIRAVLWDFGGVILTSPFDAFAAYEQKNGLPEGFIRSINATNPDTNAWARLERNEVDFDTFCTLFEDEAVALGHGVDAREVMALLAGEVRPEMVEALRRCRDAGLKTACVTNNFVSFDDFPVHARAQGRDDVLALFDVIVESSKVGVRKPDPRFYEMACEMLDVKPEETVFLDDLGINLKPARAMGITTIKVEDPARAIAELEAVVGVPLR